MYFSKKLIGNSRIAQEQWGEVNRARLMANKHEEFMLNGMGLNVNEGLIPKDVYIEFDRVGVEVMTLDDGDAFLNPLAAVSRSVSIGTLVSKFRQASDAGRAQTSMSGQIGVKMDQVEYKYDGAIVPITDAGFEREWRENAAQTAEGFDALIDDQREVTLTSKRSLATQFLDGHRDKAGNIIVLDGVSWSGMRADARVEQIDLGAGGINFDFTDQSQTGEAIKKAFIQLRDIMRIQNKCSKDLAIYISEEMATNFERRFSQNFDGPTIEQELIGLRGVASITASSKLVGNELMGYPLDGTVRPLVGMGMNTVAMPRPLYNSNHQFAVWTATGYQVKEDYNGNTCAFFAQA